MSEKSEQLKSLISQPGWKHVEEYLMAMQILKSKECDSKEASMEIIIKNTGFIQAIKHFYSWVKNSSKQDSEV